VLTNAFKGRQAPVSQFLGEFLLTPGILGNAERLTEMIVGSDENRTVELARFVQVP